MVNPFKRKRREDEGHRVWDHLFSADEPEQSATAEKAQCIVEWAARPYHKVFLEWLRDQADAPIPVNDQMALVTGTTRANTLKEVRKYLIELEQKAHDALEGFDA